MIEERVQASFDAQPFMNLLGATLTYAHDGVCEIRLAVRPELTQQHSFVHAGAIGTIADTSAGYAALSAWTDDSDVLTAEYTLNLLAPAVGDTVRARAEVIRAGKTITVCESRIYSADGGEETLCAIALVTLVRRAPGSIWLR